MKYRKEFILDQNIKTFPPAQEFGYLNESPCSDLQFRIKITFAKCISDVVLKLVKIKKQNKKVLVKLRSQYTLYIFPGFFSPNIFNHPKCNLRST